MILVVQNLPDIAAALSNAERKIRELRKESRYNNDPTLMMIVKDEAGHTVLSLPFFRATNHLGRVACAPAFAHAFGGMKQCVSWSKLMRGWKKRTPLMPPADQALCWPSSESNSAEAVYGKASLRGAYIVVDLKSPADISELMFALTWGTGGEPKFTPIMTESFDEIIGRAKSLVSPQG